MDAYSYVLNHPVGFLLGSIYILSAAVGALPAPNSPEPVKTLVYRWFFDFIHTAMNQVEKVVASRYPNQAAKLNLGVSTPSADPIKSEEKR